MKNYLTLVDWAKAQDPNGSVAKVAEMLSTSNPMMDDMAWIEGNLPTGHRSCIRAGLPTATWRRLNYGVQPSKSQRVTIDDSVGILTARNHVDEDLANLGGNAAAFRLSEAYGEIEGMNQTMQETLIYGDSDVNPEVGIVGFAPRYGTLDANVPISANVINAGGATASDNTSIYLIGWGAETIFGIFPRGSQAGLKHEDLGVGDVLDENGGTLRALRDLFTWKAGLVVKDWRYGVRIANIDVASLKTDVGAADLLKLMIRAIHKIPNMGMCKPVFYCNRVVRAALDIQALGKSQNALSIQDAAGQVSTSFLGVPIKTCDKISNAEAKVV